MPVHVHVHDILLQIESLSVMCVYICYNNNYYYTDYVAGGHGSECQWRSASWESSGGREETGEEETLREQQIW